jgi:uncharacterized protein (DUF2345 family)
MPERPNQNWESRDIFSLGPKYRTDMNNPQMGCSGSDVYDMYATTSGKDVSLTGMTESGKYRIYNDRDIEIIGGNKSNGDGIDIVIAGMNGDVTITAMKNGKVRIKGKSIMLDADEDVDIKAGRNVTLSGANGRILLKGNQVDADGLTGNVIEAVMGSFGMRAFSGSFVGADVLSGSFTGGATSIIGADGATSIAGKVAGGL